MSRTDPLTCEYCGGSVYYHKRASKAVLCGADSKMLNQRTHNPGPKFRLWTMVGRPMFKGQQGIWQKEAIAELLRQRTAVARAARKRTAEHEVIRPARLPDAVDANTLPDVRTLPVEYLRKCAAELANRVRELISELNNLPTGTQLEMFPRPRAVTPQE